MVSHSAGSVPPNQPEIVSVRQNDQCGGLLGGIVDITRADAGLRYGGEWVTHDRARVQASGESTLTAKTGRR